jgi:catalase
MELPAAMPKALPNPARPEVTRSPALSLMALPGDGGVRTRKVAILVAGGMHGASVAALQSALLDAGAVPRLVGIRLGSVQTSDGAPMQADASMENSPPVLFEALVLPDGGAAIQAPQADGHTMEFIANQYRHCKTILALGASKALLDAAGVASTLPSGEADGGVLLAQAAAAGQAAAAFIDAVARHRHYERERGPPAI